MKKTLFSLLTCSALLWMFPSCQAGGARSRVVPLENAHAHNDYRHPRPLLDALSCGFCSVEADIYLVDGDLLVAHDRRDTTPERTLRGLYLEPLRKRVAANKGRVYRRGPAFTLFVDIKSEAVSTYKALHAMLADYGDIVTSFGADGRKDGAILVVVSGNRPRELMQSQPLRYTGYDGRLSDLESEAPADFIPIISDRWPRHFTWRADGPMPEDQARKLEDIVTKAHAKGRRVRFWATPDAPSPSREARWAGLLAAGVDLINTDDLEGLQNFLLDRQ